MSGVDDGNGLRGIEPTCRKLDPAARVGMPLIRSLPACGSLRVDFVAGDHYLTVWKSPTTCRAAISSRSFSSSRRLRNQRSFRCLVGRNAHRVWFCLAADHQRFRVRCAPWLFLWEDRGINFGGFTIVVPCQFRGCGLLWVCEKGGQQKDAP